MRQAFFPRDRDHEEASIGQDEEIFETLKQFFAAADTATSSQIFSELLAPDALQYVHACLLQMQSAYNDAYVIPLKVLVSLLQEALHTDINTVVTRFFVERQQVNDALVQLEAVQEDAAFYRILEENRQILLSDLALALIIIVAHVALQTEGSVIEAGMYKQLADLIEDAQTSGLADAWKRNTEEHTRVAEALDLLEQQDTHEKCYRVLQEKQNILITERAYWLLRFHAAGLARQGSALADHYEMYAFFIKDAYLRNLVDAWNDFAGADLAFQEIQEVDEPTAILKIMQRREQALRSEVALYVLRSYIARARHSDRQDLVRYFERWLPLLKDARTSGITAAWGKFYENLVLEIYGQLASSAPQSIDTYTSALSRLTPGTLEWADGLSNRGQAHFSSVVGGSGKKEQVEQALADYSAALPVYRMQNRQDRYAETLEMLGTARFVYLGMGQDQKMDFSRALAGLMVGLVGIREDTHQPFYDPLGYRQQMIDNFSTALPLYKALGRQADWARVLLKRAAAYQLGSVGHVEDLVHAIDDYSAALTVLKKADAPFEWLGAIGNRGACYLQIMGDGYDERLTRAVADLKAALSICTRQASPALYRKLQMFLYQAYERLGKWEEAFAAIQEAIVVQRDLLAMNPGESGRLSLIADVANVQVEIYVRAAEVFLRFKQPPLPRIVCLLEEGRTQNLRLMLSLDMLDPDNMAHPAARQRARDFQAALKAWQQQQQEAPALFVSARPVSLTALTQEQGKAQEAYLAFLKTVEAIRKYDDPDFMAPTPTFDDILRAVATPQTALVYLIAGTESGMAFVLLCNEKGAHQTQYIPLPRLKARTIAQLIEVGPAKRIPIKLERSLRTLEEAGLNDVAQVLRRNGVQHVGIIPFGHLGLFPLPAVLVQASDGSKKRLGDLFEITIAPSARAIEIARKRATNLNRTTHPYLLLGGDPRPRPSESRALPYARAEAESVQRIARSAGYEENHIRYLRSVEMTKARVVKLLEHSWYAHLAVHGLYRPDNPRRSHLVLSGNNSVQEERRCLFLGEAIDRKTIDSAKELHLEGVRLLVLSACETAVIDTRQVPDEFIGLAAGFLQAGVAGVVASLWAVDDLATFLLMSRFAQLYLDPQRSWSPARSLAEAQRWLREEATNTVLMTYEPAIVATTNRKDAPADEKANGWENGIHISTVFNSNGLRQSYETGISEIHTGAAERAQHAPDALPYADAVYWAAFVVTGC